MRKSLFIVASATLALTAGALLSGVESGQAQTPTVYPWCAHYGGREGGGAPSCGSLTYAQCMATVSGQQGYCDRNPFYQGPAVPAPSMHERRIPH
jgi:hypothetical protein